MWLEGAVVESFLCGEGGGFRLGGFVWGVIVRGMLNEVKGRRS